MKEIRESRLEICKRYEKEEENSFSGVIKV